MRFESASNLYNIIHSFAKYLTHLCLCLTCPLLIKDIFLRKSRQKSQNLWRNDDSSCWKIVRTFDLWPQKNKNVKCKKSRGRGTCSSAVLHYICSRWKIFSSNASNWVFRLTIYYININTKIYILSESKQMCYNVRQIRQRDMCRRVYNPIDKAGLSTPHPLPPSLAHTQVVNLKDHLVIYMGSHAICSRGTIKVRMQLAWKPLKRGGCCCNY